MTKEPTEEQKAIIESEHKYIHVEAGPGTGKTFTLLHRIKWLVDNNKLDSTQKILFVTFTNALTNANRRDLLKLGEEYQQYVSISTLDAFLFKMVCDLGTQNQIEDAQKFDTEYSKAEKVFNTILSNMPETYLRLIAKRYPYMLVDEVQDIKKGNPKIKFVCKMSKTNQDLMFVGNANQSIYKGDSLDLSPVHCKYPLSETFRNLSINYAQYDSNSIDRVIQTEETFESEEQLFEKFEILYQDSLFESFFILCTPKCKIEKVKLRYPFFITHSDAKGQLSLPQALIESLYLKQTNKLEKLPSLLHTFRKELKADVSFTLFCSRYFASLLKARTFKDFKEADWMSYLKENSTQVSGLNSFFDAHEHLDEIPINNFQKKIIVSTIHSVKGLEADVVFLLGTPNTPNLNYVAKTRHKKHFYHYP
jgi:superfamily I DNA/RNA helicase